MKKALLGCAVVLALFFATGTARADHEDRGGGSCRPAYRHPHTHHYMRPRIDHHSHHDHHHHHHYRHDYHYHPRSSFYRSYYYPRDYGYGYGGSGFGISRGGVSLFFGF